MIDEELLNDLRDDIERADKVLIGIGLEWQLMLEAKEEYLSKASVNELINCIDIDYSVNKREELMEVYANLKNKLMGKDYYIISLCYDDVVYDVFFKDENIVTPCGGYKLLQCGQHIMSRDEVAINNGVTVCPLCAGTLSYNNIKNEHYMEESYLPKFQEYKAWIQSTINRKLLIVELGTDMKFPGVIRFAFDRLVKFNQKSKMYRINKQLCMVDSSAEGRGIAVKCDSLELIKKM